MMIDFAKIPNDLKNVLIHIIIMPYWYISIYIFHPVFYKSADNLLLISLCLCLTISSSFVTVIVVSKRETYVLDFHNSKMSVVLQIGLFSLLLIVAYISKIEFDNTFYFYGFVITYFVLLLFSALITFDKEKGKEKEVKKE